MSALKVSLITASGAAAALSAVYFVYNYVAVFLQLAPFLLLD